MLLKGFWMNEKARQEEHCVNCWKTANKISTEPLGL